MEFTNGDILDILDNDKNFIIKKTKKLIKKDMYIGSRIGLSNKYPEFETNSYRFVVKKDLIKKQKSKLILM